MNNKLNYFLQSLIPCLIMGVTLAMLIGLLILFSYVLVWGLFIGGMFWLALLVKNFLFPKKIISKTEGNIIEHNENK